MHHHGNRSAALAIIMGAALLAAGAACAQGPSPATLIAHRGESCAAPENTLPAYRTAVERGFGFECDIYLSRDGRLFTFHDETLARTTGGADTNRCTESDWAGAISRANVGGWGRWKGSKFDPTRPALFSEVLKLARDGRWIYVEVKGSDPKWVPCIKAELAKAPRANPGNVLFISFSDRVCAELKRQLPGWKVYWLTVGSRTTPEKIVAKLREIGADGVDVGFDPDVVDKDYVAAVKSAGFSFHAWTVDDPAVARRAFDAGVDTLTTNRAKELLAELAPVEQPAVPELMRTEDGREVKSRETWERVRRGEIRRLFEREIYGRRPAEKPARLSFSPAGPDKTMLAGKAVRKLVRVSYGDRCGDSSFVVTAFIPVSGVRRPAPAFLLICNRNSQLNFDPERNVRSGFWPVEQIVGRGYAAIAFYNGDVARDGDWGFANGVFSVFQPPEERTPESWGVLSAWAWGASRVMDWIETEPTLDARRVAVVGHSRGGKTSLLAAVTDERFAMACVNDSGCGGAKLNHMELPLSEHYDQIHERFGFWFCGNFRKYLGREHLAPFDAHWWAALVAPRLLAVGSATEDHWAGQEGEFETARLASPAWALYGLKGLVGDRFPAPDAPLQDGCVAYHLRKGGHDLTPVDWGWYMDFADRHGWTAE